MYFLPNVFARMFLFIVFVVHRIIKFHPPLFYTRR